MTGCTESKIAWSREKDAVEKVDEVRKRHRVTMMKRVAVNADFLVLKPCSIEAERLLIPFDARPMDEAI